MNKSLATLGISLLMTGCAYNPVIDTGGRSGTFNQSKADKITDILRDFNIKLDDIKSDTELIKEYSEQIEQIFEKIDDMEDFLKDKLQNDFEKIVDAWKDYKAEKIPKKKFISIGIKMLGKRFIKAFMSSIPMMNAFLD